MNFGERSPARPARARAQSFAPPHRRACCPAGSMRLSWENGVTKPSSRAISRDAIAPPSMVDSTFTFWRPDVVNTSAAELMNRTYRHQRHIYNFTRKYYLLGRDRLIAEIDARDGACVLEIGCGTGRNLIVTARKYPGARCFGIDVSTEMLSSAMRAISCTGLVTRICVAQADATRFDPQSLFGITQFDRIFISYSLSMIARW